MTGFRQNPYLKCPARRAKKHSDGRAPKNVLIYNSGQTEHAKKTLTRPRLIGRTPNPAARRGMAHGLRGTARLGPSNYRPGLRAKPENPGPAHGPMGETGDSVMN